MLNAGVLALFLLLLAALLARSVAVPHADMSHCSNLDARGLGPPLGRDCDAKAFLGIGSIDPGDLVVLGSASGLETAAGAASSHAGRGGDVVFVEGTPPLPRRLLFWVEKDGELLSAPELGIFNVTALDPVAAASWAGCSLEASRLVRSGYVTRGDNNPRADQCETLQPVEADEIVGRTWVAIPGAGMYALWWNDAVSGTSNGSHALPENQFLGVAYLLVLVLLVAALVWGRRRRTKGAQDAGGPSHGTED